MVKQIEVKKWKELVSGEEHEVTTLMMLSLLVNNKDPSTLPKGIDGFRTFHRLAIAFEDAEKTGRLLLDDNDYNFLKEIIIKEIPSSWGRNKDIVVAIEEFVR